MEKMTWPRAAVFIAAFLCLAYCGTRKTIDCHDWTAQECIEFVESVKGL